MKREDLRNRIIPTIIENTDEYARNGNKKFDTTDLIYLDNYQDQFNSGKTSIERKISATDYAKMNNAYIYSYGYNKTRAGKQTSCMYTRSSNSMYVICINENGFAERKYGNFKNVGICPSLHYKFSSDVDIKEVIDYNGEIIYHILKIGEYPKTKVDEDLSQTLESLYNNGNLKEGISPTGRWYSCNGEEKNEKDYAGKHSPEFEYEGDRYVRVVSHPDNKVYRYSDGTEAGEIGTIRWTKVEPISFVIKNWDDMPKNINKEGSGKAEYFDLIAEEVITSNIPFYPSRYERNGIMWQNSCIRGFLNGIDVRNITQNGVLEYIAPRGGNFTGECNFLNEAFNLSRQPIVEYTIPDSEKEIPDDAFNGCVTLKRLILHPGINSIGKRAFDGINFKYLYKTENGKIIFSKDLIKNEEKYKNVIEFEEILKAFKEFNYETLCKSEEIDDLISFSKFLNKNKFNIPYVYGIKLLESGNFKSFCENSDFRFFKNEILNINDKLSNYSDEEKLNFFKFANALGCFKAEKILDKKGKETEALLAQKASSLLAQLLKTDEMKLR